MDWARITRHLFASSRRTRTMFPDVTMKRLRQVIADGETRHRGEVRLIVESALPLRKVRRGMGTRQRALDLFGTYRVWDTEENNGVLLYINVADRKIEIVADRAAARLVGDPHWRAACGVAEEAFRSGAFERGIAGAIEAIHRTLLTAFPAVDDGIRRNEISDEPVLR